MKKAHLIDVTNNSKLDPKSILPTMFINSAFQRLAVNDTRPNELWFGDPDGLKIGVAVIFPSRSGDDCSLSEPVFERLLAGKRSRKIDCAYVVQAERRGAQRIFVDCRDAEELQPKLSSLPTIKGDYQQFAARLYETRVQECNDPYPVEGRAVKLAELNAELDALIRVEYALVDAAITSGSSDETHDPRMPPAVMLGVRVN